MFILLPENSKLWKQGKALELLLTGRDILAILPTGNGESKIYQVFRLVKLNFAFNPNASVSYSLGIRKILEQVDRAGSLCMVFLKKPKL